MGAALEVMTTNWKTKAEMKRPCAVKYMLEFAAVGLAYCFMPGALLSSAWVGPPTDPAAPVIMMAYMWNEPPCR